MQLPKSTIGVTLGACALVLSACAGTVTSKYAPDTTTYAINRPVKDRDCYDASVILGVDLQRAQNIARKVLTALDAKITTATESELRAQRNRHMGVFVGSGGEDLRIHLREVDAAKTFMTATTKTGFVGGAGQKAWSCQIVDEAVKLAGS